MVNYQNITEIQIVKDQTESHRKSILNQFGSEVQNRRCTLQDDRFSLKSVKNIGVEVIEMDQKIPQHQSHKTYRRPTSSTLVPKWLSWSGNRNPRALHWLSALTSRGPPVWCSGILAHIIHIPSKLNKQQVPYAEVSEYHCYLQLCHSGKLSERGAGAVAEFKYGML